MLVSLQEELSIILKAKSLVLISIYNSGICMYKVSLKNV